MQTLIVSLLMIVGVTALGYVALSGGSSAPVVSEEEIARMSDIPPAQAARPAADSLQHGLNVVTGGASRSVPSVADNTAGALLEGEGLRRQVFQRLEDRDISYVEREAALSQLWPEVGKSIEINQEIFKASLLALNPLQDGAATPESHELRGLVHRSVSLMVASNPDPLKAVQEVVSLLERVPNAQVRKVVVDSFANSYYDGKSIIRRELASHALPVSEDEADTSGFPAQAVPAPSTRP